MQAIINKVLKTITDDIKEAEDTNFGKLKELFFDEIWRDVGDEDPDGYDLIFAKKPPSQKNFASNMLMNRVEIYIENDTKAELSEECVTALKKVLPKHCKYLWSDKDNIGLQSAYFKGTKGYLVLKPGYKGPVEMAPETEVASLSNGYSVKALLHPDEIKTEGRHLSHCVGRRDMGYLEKVKEGSLKLYSIRDPKGSALFTVEESGGRITQIKGMKNRTPGYGPGASKLTKKAEVAAVMEWLNSRNIDPTSIGDMRAAVAVIKE